MDTKEKLAEINNQIDVLVNGFYSINDKQDFLFGLDEIIRKHMIKLMDEIDNMVEEKAAKKSGHKKEEYALYSNLIRGKR